MEHGKPLDRFDKDELEALVDKYSLTYVLDALAEIANEKAEHITTNWQDETLADLWGKAADKIDAMAFSIVLV